jgi:hypothetical protein
MKIAVSAVVVLVLLIASLGAIIPSVMANQGYWTASNTPVPQGMKKYHIFLGWRFVVENTQLADSMKYHHIPDNLIDIGHLFYGSNGQLLIGHNRINIKWRSETSMQNHSYHLIQYFYQYRYCWFCYYYLTLVRIFKFY